MTTHTSTLFLLGWLAVGAAVAAWGHREGRGPGFVASAVIAWPFLLPALADGSPQGAAAARIDAALLRLSAHADLVPPGTVAALAEALRAADARLARADAALAAAPPSTPGHAAACVARDRARSDLTGTLDELDALTLQASLADLGGGAAALADRLSSLRARLAATHEVAGLASNGRPGRATEGGEGA